MCGFVGFINKDSISNPESTIKKMNDSIIHRGPDDEGYWSDLDQDLFLGFRRLAIIDLTKAGHQPMVSSSARYVMTLLNLKWSSPSKIQLLLLGKLVRVLRCAK